MSSPVDLRVVVFREGDYWLAQGLEFDIGVQGDNLKDLISRLGFLLSAEIADHTLEALPPSPKYFQDLWTFRAGAFHPSEAFLATMPDDVRVTYGMVA